MLCGRRGTGVTSEVHQGRTAFRRRAWSEAYDRLSTADETEPEDLQRLAVTAYMLGRDDECARWWERAHDAWLARGDLLQACDLGSRPSSNVDPY